MITVETIINNVSYTIEFSDIPTLSITQAVAAANTATAAMSIVETKRVEVENTAVIVQENSAAAAQDRQTTQALRNETEGFKNTAVNAANQAIEYVATNEYVTRAGNQEIMGAKTFRSTGDPTAFARLDIGNSNYLGHLITLIYGSNYVGGSKLGVGANGVALFQNGDAAFAILTTFLRPILFGINNVEKMRLSQSGNLLLQKTVDSGEALQVGGDARIDGTVTASNFIGNASSSSLLTGSRSGLTTQHGDGMIGYSWALLYQQAGLFPAVDNSNAIITINRHFGDFYSQLGFSSDGNLYYRSFSATPINTTQAWRRIIDSSNIGSQTVGVSELTNNIRWRNYGEGHVIFDASAGITPGGTSISNVDSQVEWAATSPTLMGWNGSNTYGVRVDRARVSDVASSVIETSSLRYKQDVETLENALDTVLSMRGVSYVRKDNGEKEIGFIAEEVHELLPDVVVLNKEQQPDAIAYSRIIPVLVEAMKQQQEQIDELKKQDELRSKEIQDLKNIVNYLKTKL